MSSFYIISKLFTYLILPPGIFIILFFLAAFYARRFKAIFIFFALSFYLLSNSYVADFLLRPLEAPYNKPLNKSKAMNGVIVLGGGSVAGSANLPLASDAFKRAMWGLMIAKSQNLPILFSGGSLYKKYTDADAFLDCAKEVQDNFGSMMPFLEKLVLNKFSLHVEDKSLNTYQNAKFSKLKFEQLGINNPTIYLATSAYHMKRSKILFEYFGFKVIPAATDFKVSSRLKTKWDYLPKMEAFEKSYIAIHEYIGLLSLKLRGI